MNEVRAKGGWGEWVVHMLNGVRTLRSPRFSKSCDSFYHAAQTVCFSVPNGFANSVGEAVHRASSSAMTSTLPAGDKACLQSSEAQSYSTLQVPTLSMRGSLLSTVSYANLMCSLDGVGIFMCAYACNASHHPHGSSSTPWAKT